MGLATGHDPDSADYYTELDLEALANRIHGPAFATWLLRRVSAIELLCRLAEEAGVVLLPGKGFGDPYPSARISLANLNDYEYRAVGRAVRKLLDDYHAEFTG
jgi:aspartate 4-decarboxylase